MEKKWWKESVVYQIYPRSFMDSNGDGIGDINGIIAKLDYLKDLGIDVIWLSPVYQSPNHDNGYDISDFHDIMPEFGNMDHWELFLETAHSKGMKVIMDMVLNHTSHQHPWFIESKKSKDNPYREYYIWRRGKDFKEPNNWMSIFGGSAWEYDELTQEYYLHLFAKEQPDLNWDSPKLRNEMYNMLLWWLEKGVDGFRFDAISHLKKADGLPDGENPYNQKYVTAWNYISNQKELMGILHELKSKVYSDREIMTIGEMASVRAEDVLRYVHDIDGVFSMLVQFDHMGIDKSHSSKWETRQWNLRELKDIMNRWQKSAGEDGWNSLYLESHDHPRSVSRFGQEDGYHEVSAKMLATFYQLMKGTPFIYQGQEIGMTNIKLHSLDEYNDVEIHNFYHESLKNGRNHDEILEEIWKTGRDNARTPMQWDDSDNAGFTSGVPWLPINENYKNINVKAQMKNKHSIFNYYKKLINLRREHPALIYGDYNLILEDNMEIYSYLREFDQKIILVICNFFGGNPVFELPQKYHGQKHCLLSSNYPVNVDQDGDVYFFKMRPYEARVYEFDLKK